MAESEPPYMNEPMMKAMLKICTGDPPKLKEPEKWSKEFNQFLSDCLVKEPTGRPTSTELLEHPFIKSAADPKQVIIPLLVSLGVILPPTDASMKGSKDDNFISKPTPKGTDEDPAVLALKTMMKSLQEELKEEKEKQKSLQTKLAEAESKVTDKSKAELQQQITKLTNELKAATDKLKMYEDKEGKSVQSYLEENHKSEGDHANGKAEKCGKKKKKIKKKKKEKKQETTKIPNIEDEVKDLDRAGVVARLKLMDAQYRALQQTNTQANATIHLLLEDLRKQKG